MVGCQWYNPRCWEGIIHVFLPFLLLFAGIPSKELLKGSVGLKILQKENYKHRVKWKQHSRWTFGCRHPFYDESQRKPSARATRKRRATTNTVGTQQKFEEEEIGFAAAVWGIFDPGTTIWLRWTWSFAERTCLKNPTRSFVRLIPIENLSPNLEILGFWPGFGPVFLWAL